MNTAGSLSKDVGDKSGYNSLAVPRYSFYHWCNRDSQKDNFRQVPLLPLIYDERKEVFDILHEEQFVN